MNRGTILRVVLVCLTPSLSIGAQAPSTPPAAQKPAALSSNPGETKAQRDARMAWWREARFGMFIHWGIYAVPAGSYKGKQIRGIGEWIMNYADIPVAEYAKYAEQFNPTKFKADEWVALAKAAGMKYMVITSKHHDGFAMFDSKVDGYDIVDATPFKRDVIKELSEACQKQGIKFGVYYSQAQDWHHAGGAAIIPSNINARATAHWDAAQDGDMGQYLDKVAVPQVKELLTNYGPLAVLWWDTPTDMTKERADKFLPLLKSQPQIITNNRLGGGYQGDTETPEQRIPPTGYPDRDWETCMTINDTWGYKSFDLNFKTADTLIRSLIDIASKGGNYLLNVGPTAEGVIPAPEVQRLQSMGRWLQVNGEAIYGSGPTAFGPEAGEFSKTEKDRAGQPRFIPRWEWRCTTKPGKLYIHLFQWPGEKFEVSNLKGQVTKAYLLADPKRQPLAISEDLGVVGITLPASAPDPIASVLCLEIQAAK